MNYFDLLTRLFGAYDKLRNKQLTDRQFLYFLKKAVPYTECNIRINRTLNVYPSSIIEIAGLYDAELDSESENPIDIEVSIHKMWEAVIFDEKHISLDRWAEFCIDFATILGHEFIHMNQFRRRNFNMNRPYVSKHKNKSKRDLQNYLGDSDEVDAYAWTAAANAVVELKPYKRKITSTRIYKMYVNAFDKDDPVVLKLVRKANTYFKKLEKQKNETRTKYC
jgi:hypothetical protein